MNYLDTDVLIHSMVNQNANLHLKTNDLIEEMTNDGSLVISCLSIQEVGFVLAKLGQETSFIVSRLSTLIASLPINYGVPEVTRAIELAKVTGFKSFNDCIHLAIAEQYCTNFFTCNYKDFKRIQPHTSLIINFL